MKAGKRQTSNTPKGKRATTPSKSPKRAASEAAAAELPEKVTASSKAQNVDFESLRFAHF